MIAVITAVASTFFGVLAISDIDHSPKAKVKVESTLEVDDGDTLPTQAQPESVLQVPLSGVQPSLHYNIQIHLPATKDIEVYNSIFKSLKEHLLG